MLQCFFCVLIKEENDCRVPSLSCLPAPTEPDNSILRGNERLSPLLPTRAGEAQEHISNALQHALVYLQKRALASLNRELHVGRAPRELAHSGRFKQRREDLHLDVQTFHLVVTMPFEW